MKFETDDAAFESIMNCEGIPINGFTAGKLSSQCGPMKKNKRVMGRIVPFQKPTPNSRFSLNTTTSQAIGQVRKCRFKKNNY